MAMNYTKGTRRVLPAAKILATDRTDKQGLWASLREVGLATKTHEKTQVEYNRSDSSIMHTDGELYFS